MLKENRRSIDYNIQGFYKERLFDSKGDVVTVNFYIDYDGTTYSNLTVRETRVYTRSAITGLLEKREMTIEWFEDDGITIYDVNVLTKYYNSTEGFVNNKRARRNLLNTASMYLLSQVGLVNAKLFWKTLGTDDYKDYKTVGDLAIVTSINNSTETYMTPAIKTTLTTILNIIY